MLWDESTDDLVLTLGAELYFYDAAGGEHIKSDGTDMTIYAGTDLNLTAGTDINIPVDVGLTFGNDGEKIEGDGTNLVVSSSGTLDLNSAGVLTLDSGAAINIEPAGGSAILLDGTISIDAGTVTTASGNLSIDAASGSHVRVNDAQADVDFVVESNIGDNLINTNAQYGAIGLNRAGSAACLIITGGSYTTSAGSTGGVIRMLTSLTGAVDNSFYGLLVENTLVEAASGTHPVVAQIGASGGAITQAGSTTTTNGATIYVDQAMSGATNNYSLFVDAGAVRFDGAISLGTDHGDDGQQLTSGGDDAACDWTAASSLREHKHIGKEADPNEALQAILGSTPYHFQYKQSMGTGDSATEYVGVMADDAPWAMHYKGTIVNPVNALGYTVLGFQAMAAQIKALETKVKELEHA